MFELPYKPHQSKLLPYVSSFVIRQHYAVSIHWTRLADAIFIDILSAQSRNRYNSEIVLRKVGILTLTGEGGAVQFQNQYEGEDRTEKDIKRSNIKTITEELVCNGQKFKINGRLNRFGVETWPALPQWFETFS